MSEIKFNVGDLVVLNEKGESLFRDLRDVPMRIETIGNGICKCSLKGSEKPFFIGDSLIEHFNKEELRSISTKEIESSELTNQMVETFKKKNADYGDSTTQTFEEFGLTSYAVRLSD
jgi:hypothetical protein